MAILTGNRPPTFTLHPVQSRDGALSPTIECSTKDWLNSLARPKNSLSLKTHGPSERELTDNAAYQIINE